MLLRLQQITYLSEEIKAFRFTSPDGQLLPGASAGSHITVTLSHQLKRSYSLLNTGEQLSHYDIAVKKESAGRGGSKFMHESLMVGKLIDVAAPVNFFELSERAEHYVLIADGIGVTPIYAMWQALKQRNASYTLHYASRSAQDGIMLTEFALDPNCKLHFDAESGIFNMSQAIAEAPEKAHFFCCGPGPMLDAYHKACAHLPPEQIHFEQFAPAASLNQTLNVDSYEVYLAKSEQRFVVPRGQSILDCLLAAGHDLNYSCQQGICGQCETEVLVGEPCHKDQILTEAEKQANRSMMICCSSSRSPKLVFNL
ncbi:MAG TPA: oxidoreductase [Methylophaga aminisulfidivorans]|uniref:PDR/VanB family oxidoreductase n=1 Tax=Methylophaga aminisulfidivorans TaxID=230105 RepID=UPI001A1545D8|nr:PDR/VanB family oxidoreductase [Methylophaga aminisulfidivorans]HIM39864.1 oxidoreductase [Methylophaga aminisulfidivorans]